MEGLEKLLKATNALGLDGEDAMDFIREERRLEREKQRKRSSQPRKRSSKPRDTVEREEMRHREQLEAEENQLKFEADEKTAASV